MKFQCATTPELSPAMQEGASDARQSARRGYFDRKSQTIERGVLAFVILLALLGNYASNCYLMSDHIISWRVESALATSVWSR